MATKQQHKSQGSHSSGDVSAAAQQYVEQASDQCAAMVQNHPVGAILATFGLGLAVGAIGVTLMGRSSPPPVESSWLAGLHRQISDSVTDNLHRMFGSSCSKSS